MPGRKFKHNWNKELHAKLQQRNEKCKTFEELIQITENLHLKMDWLESEKCHFRVEAERLKIEYQLLEEQEVKHNRRSNSMPDKGKHLFQRKESELYAEQLVDLKTKLEEKDKLLNATCLRLEEAENHLTELWNKLHKTDEALNVTNYQLEETEKNLASALDVCQSYEERIQENEDGNEVLRNELKALKLMYDELVKEYRELKQGQSPISTPSTLILKPHDSEVLKEQNDSLPRTLQWLAPLLPKKQRFGHKQAPTTNEDATIESWCELTEENDSSPTRLLPPSDSHLPHKVIHKFHAHDGEIQALQWVCSGEILASGGSDGIINLWKIYYGSHKRDGKLTGMDYTITSINFSPGEETVMGSCSDGMIRFWDMSTKGFLYGLFGHGRKVYAAQYLSSGDKIASGSNDRTLKIWDLKRRACVQTIAVGSTCFDLTVSTCNIISGHFDHHVRFWDMRSNTTPITQYCLEGKVTSLHLSPDEDYLLCAVRNKSLKVIDIRNHQVLREYSHETFMVGLDYTRAQFSPDGQHIAAGGNDGNIYIWNFNTSKTESISGSHGSTVVSCAWSPDGQTLVTCDRQGKIAVRMATLSF